MPELSVYGVPGSPFLRAVEVALIEKGAPYRLKAMPPAEMKTPAHLEKHPFGRIPWIEHGDFTLYETQAIVRYADAAFKGPSLQPADVREKARMDQAIGVNDWYLFPKASAIVFNRIIGPRLLGRAADEDAIRAAVPDTERAVAALEKILGTKPYLASDAFTLADVVVAPQIALISMTPEGAPMVARSRLAPWLDRVSRRESMIKTQPPEALRKAA